MLKNKKGPLIKSFYHAFVGIWENLLKERNLKIHFFIMGLVIISGLFFKISILEWFVCLVLFGIVISLELVNTAIEIVVDIYVKEISEEARMAKDTAAGAVLVSAIVAAVVGLIIFIPKGIDFISNCI